MLGRLHFMGTRIVDHPSDATQLQYAFLQLACVEYTDEEREFQAQIHGVKLKKQSNDVRQAGLEALKHPDEIKKDG